MFKRPRTESTTSSLISEEKRLKIDLIAAKTQITKLESDMRKQTITITEKQIMFENEKSSFLEQHKNDEKAVADMKKKLEIVERREKYFEEDHKESLEQLQISQHQWDKEKAGLQKQISNLKDKLLETKASSDGQLSKMKKDKDALLQGLKAANSEVEMLKKETTRLSGIGEKCFSFRTQLEKQTFELQQVTNKLKALEYEKESFGDWKQLAKTAEKRLCNMEKLEQEVILLKFSEKTFRGAFSNKLYLEEQVHSLTLQVERMQRVEQELHETKVKLSSLESSLEEWKNAAKKYGVESVNVLASTLETSLHDQLIAAVKCSEMQSEKAQLTEELATTKNARDQLSAKLDDLLNLCKSQQSHKQRLQKRLNLLTMDRDSYKQQLECYEQTPTVSIDGDSDIGTKALLLDKVEKLKKILQSYRDLLVEHDMDGDDETLTTDYLELSKWQEVSKWREEAESAQREANKLRIQRDNFQMHIERLATTYHTTHPTPQDLQIPDNPTTAAYKQMQGDLEAAQEEIKLFKAAQRDGASTSCPEEKQELEQQPQHSQNELQRMQDELKSLEEEYKNAVLVLFGYKIERIETKSYKITSIYAQSDDDYCTLRIIDGETIFGHGNNYANCVEMMQLHLQIYQSIPMFLSSLTIELFTKQFTIDIDIN